MRGEKSLVLSCMVRRLGSPPRARGKDRSIRSDEHPPGITPACAGKRRRPQRWWAFGRDHPRVRGEKSPPLVSCFATWGSPPRARGKDGDSPSKTDGGWDHPRVRGGKGKVKAFFDKSQRDHPRVRGEKEAYPVPGPERTGSPPRARGKGITLIAFVVGMRITPACAGKSSSRIRNFLSE